MMMQKKLNLGTLTVGEPVKDALRNGVEKYLHKRTHHAFDDKVWLFSDEYCILIDEVMDELKHCYNHPMFGKACWRTNKLYVEVEDDEIKRITYIFRNRIIIL